MSRTINDVVVLDRGNYTTCTIRLHGGTIISYRVNNKEFLYMKERTVLNHVSPIRGGIKYTFPYFGTRIHGPKHGFARYVLWKLASGPTTLDDGNIEVVLCLEQSEYTKAMWNYKFKMSLKVTLCLTRLLVSIKVENTCSHFPFLFNILRHSIFRVEDVRNIKVLGLSNCQYFKFEPKARIIKDPNPDEKHGIKINRAFLDVYLKPPPVVEVLNIDNKGLKLRITCCDSSSPDVLLYNPWLETGSVSKDSLHNPGEYLHCLGVGNGYLNADIRLEPKQIWESRQIIEIIDEEHDIKLRRLGELLNNPSELLREKCAIANTVM